MKHVHEGIENVKASRIADRTPDSFLFVIVTFVQQAAMEGIMHGRTDRHSQKKKNGARRHSFARLLIERRSLENGHRSINCHTRIQPLIHMNASAQQVIHDETLHV